MLLLEGALRIQDVVDVKFGFFTRAESNEKGHSVVTFPAKKSVSRTVTFSKEAIDAVKAYRDKRDATDEDVMFEPGRPGNETSALSHWVQRRFKKHGQHVTSHDFRKTTATNFYDSTKDPMLTKDFLGHSSVVTMQLYI